MRNKKKCYVIMPFSKTKSCTKEEWTEIFEHVFKPAVGESGLSYECVRSRAKRENIIKGIVNDLNTAQAVIADLTDRNPNVFYELGVRHTLKNRTILIAQHEEDIPFDLKPYPTMIYNHRSPAGVNEFKREIKGKLEDIEANPERADNPVADFLIERNIDLLSSEKKANLKKLGALLSELSYNMDLVDAILNTIKESKELRKKEKGKFKVSNLRFANACLELLLSTQYIILGSEMFEEARALNFRLTTTNSRLELWREASFVKSVEKGLKEDLPMIKEQLSSLLKKIGKIHIDYENDNYVEPELVAIVSSHELREYLQAMGWESA